MQLKVYRGSFAIIALVLLGLMFFMLPILLVFIAIATVASLLGSIATGLIAYKTKITKQTNTSQTIDIAAEIE